MSLWSWWKRSRTTAGERWVVLDVEATGLDPMRDHLLSIAAVAVHVDAARPRIALGDSFEVLIHQEARPVDKANILVHGIGLGAQRSGVAPHDALQAFEQYVAQAPLIAFHSPFDQTLLDRAFRTQLGHALCGPWVDLAEVAAALRPQSRAKALDDWLAIFGIECAARHQAAADTLATAELLLRLWPDIVEQGATPGWRGLQSLATQRRWLGGQ